MKHQVTIDKSRLCLFLLFIVSFPNSYGQCNLEENQYVIYKYDSTSLKYTEFVFKNNSQDTIYLWIDPDVVYNDSLTYEQNNYVFFLQYIQNPHGELGLNFLCNDHNINFTGVLPPPPVIGCTFITKILPSKSFDIIALNEKVGKNAIHYVKQDFVARIFRIERLDKFCYGRSEIIVW